MAGKQIKTHPKVRKLQRTLYQQAKKNPKWRAWSLYADLCRGELIEEAMSRVWSNRGGSGVDGYTVQAMKADWEQFRDSLQSELRDRTYRPEPVRRIRIPKSNGGIRLLGIPTVKDRVVQTILVILLEPIFETDFHSESYGYRPGKKAVQAVESLKVGIYYGKKVAIEADLSRYFDTVDHERLMRLVTGASFPFGLCTTMSHSDFLTDQHTLAVLAACDACCFARFFGLRISQDLPAYLHVTSEHSVSADPAVMMNDHTITVVTRFSSSPAHRDSAFAGFRPFLPAFAIP